MIILKTVANMKNISNLTNDYLNTLKKTIDSISYKEVNEFISALIKAYENKNQIFIMGNGGSAATASHFACDINKGISFKLDKKFKVISLSDNIPTMMAYANDVTFDDIFLEQLKNFLAPNDLVIGISGSGNSKNVIKAIEYANRKNAITIGITGYDGGKLKQISHLSINANIDDMQISEDIHMILVHLTMRLLSQILIKT